MLARAALGLHMRLRAALTECRVLDGVEAADMLGCKFEFPTESVTKASVPEYGLRRSVLSYGMRRRK